MRAGKAAFRDAITDRAPDARRIASTRFDAGARNSPPSPRPPLPPPARSRTPTPPGLPPDHGGACPDGTPVAGRRRRAQCRGSGRARRGVTGHRDLGEADVGLQLPRARERLLPDAADPGPEQPGATDG